MGAGLAATFYTLLALGLAAALLPSERFFRGDWRVFAFWAAGACLQFNFADHLLGQAIAFGLLLLLAPVSVEHKVAMYIATFAFLPKYIETPIPFPGLNNLINLSPYKVSAFALLVPVFFSATKGRPPGSISFVAALCVIAYPIYTYLMVSAITTPTDGLRFLFEQCVIFVLPFFAILRVVNTEEDLEECLYSFVLVATILAAIALVSTGKQWNLYTTGAPATFETTPDYRWGLLRVIGTTNTHSLGYFMVAGLFLLEALKSRIGLGRLRLWALRAAMLAALVFTGSRGSMIALAAGAMLYFVLSQRFYTLRWLLMMAATLALGISAFWLATGDLKQVDDLGTFDYRQKLISTCLEFIYDYPFFGDLEFLKTYRFDDLIQGQQIVDLTNLYLQYGVQFGLVGVGFFFGIFYPPFLR